jgi:sugar lactone lactonase YvrE
MNFTRIVLGVCLTTAPLAAQNDSTWRDHDRAQREARLRGDWAASRAHLERMDATLTGHPSIVLALARASAQLGDTARVVAELERLAAAGVMQDVEADSQLVAMRHVPAVASLIAKLKANRASVGAFHAVATMPEVDFVAEGVVWDAARQRLLVSSMRHRRIDAVQLNGKVSRFLDVARDGSWSPLGMAVDAARNRLWVTTEWSPFGLNASRADSGLSDVLQYDLPTGKLNARYQLPRDGGPHEPGDIAVAPNGDLFVSDGRAAIMYVVRNGKSSLDTLVRAGPLVSPQGVAPDPDGKRLFVADYALGIVTVDRTSGDVRIVPRPTNVAANGIDGLVLHGDQLIGVQNGVVPNRLIAFDLDAAHTRIIGARTLMRDTLHINEPTHLVAVGDVIYYVANGGFGAYDAQGVLKPGLTQAAPVIARVRVPRMKK